MTNISVKLATLQDLPSIRALWRALATEVAPTYPTNILAAIDTFTRSIALALAAQPAAAFCFLGARAGIPDPEGFLLYEIQTRLLGEPSRMGFVHYAYVHPTARSHGILTAMAQMAAEHMLVQGLTEAEVTTQPASARWWTDLGFIPYETRSHCSIPHAVVGLDNRARTRAAYIGNGLDAHTPAEPAPAAAEEESDEGA
jgi:hypothetical protein